MFWELLEFVLIAGIVYCTVALIIETYFAAKRRHWNYIINEDSNGPESP